MDLDEICYGVHAIAATLKSTFQFLMIGSNKMAVSETCEVESALMPLVMESCLLLLPWLP
jgi:hypothetical protein